MVLLVPQFKSAEQYKMRAKEVVHDLVGWKWSPSWNLVASDGVLNYKWLLRSCFLKRLKGDRCDAFEVLEKEVEAMYCYVIMYLVGLAINFFLF